MKNVTRLAEVELTAKVAASIHAEMLKGKRPSDMGPRDFAAIAEPVLDKLSPEAKRFAIRQGVEAMVRWVLGEKIAEAIWDSGLGWPENDEVTRSIARKLKFSDLDDAVQCLAAYREHIAEVTFSGLDDFQLLGRFAPLFIAQPEDAMLGEVATIKAARGDKLALSFLAWKETA